MLSTAFVTALALASSALPFVTANCGSGGKTTGKSYHHKKPVKHHHKNSPAKPKGYAPAPSHTGYAPAPSHSAYTPPKSTGGGYTAPKPPTNNNNYGNTGSGTTDDHTTTYSPKGTYNNPSSGSSWHQKDSVSGEDLLNWFTWETQSSSSQGGVAQYTGLDDAKSRGMVGVDNGVTYLGVDTGDASGGGRHSIRLSSKEQFNSGTIFAIDVAHLPTGCGTWPAIWTVAQDGDWPGKGELDIVEGVNDFCANALSAHTKDGFNMHTDGFTSNFMMTTSDKTVCSVYKTDDQGCGLRDPDLASFGKPFNDKKGGTYVMKWDDSEVAMWLFPAGSLPADLQSGNPKPDGSWGAPRALYRDTSGQKTANYFQDHVLVINTNLCGAWPEGVWNHADTSVGQDKSCAASTGYSSCSEFVKNEGGAFKDAYFAIRSIKVYEQSW